jgi:hypothetical protein
MVIDPANLTGLFVQADHFFAGQGHVNHPHTATECGMTAALAVLKWNQVDSALFETVHHSRRSAAIQAVAVEKTEGPIAHPGHARARAVGATWLGQEDGLGCMIHGLRWAP